SNYGDNKVLGCSDDLPPGSQLPVIRKRVPEKHLRTGNLCDDRTPEQASVGGAVHCLSSEPIKNSRRHPSQAESERYHQLADYQLLSPGLSAGFFHDIKEAQKPAL